MICPMKTHLFELTVILAILTFLQICELSRHYVKHTDCQDRSISDIPLTSRSNGGKDGFDNPASRHAEVGTINNKYRDTLIINDYNDNRMYLDFPNHSWDVCSPHLVRSLLFGYCPVPKAASSSLKAIILQAEHMKDPGDNANEISSAFDRHPSVAASAYCRDQPGQTYVMAIVVRHPFERLVSAYVDRVRTTKPWIKGAKRLYRNGFVGSGPNGTFTFKEFVPNILKDPVETWDVHWAPHTPRCRPCSFRYDVIVKVETLDRDLEELLPRLGLAGLKFPKRNAKRPRKKAEARKAFACHFSELTRQQVLQLFAIYADDFETHSR